jgi:hypothetical protein
MKQAAPRCKKMMKASCVDTFDGMGCQAAATFCAVELQLPFFTTGIPIFDDTGEGEILTYILGMNPYDISKECEGKLEETLCYPATKSVPPFYTPLILTMLNKPYFRMALTQLYAQTAWS